MARKSRARRPAAPPPPPSPSPPLKIFISHSHKDQEAVDKIVTRLELDGHDVWMDRLQLKPGDNFQRKIQEGLNEADVLLVVLSENSFKSPWVQHEFTTIA